MANDNPPQGINCSNYLILFQLYVIFHLLLTKVETGEFQNWFSCHVNHAWPWIHSRPLVKVVLKGEEGVWKRGANSNSVLGGARVYANWGFWTQFSRCAGRYGSVDIYAESQEWIHSKEELHFQGEQKHLLHKNQCKCIRQTSYSRYLNNLPALNLSPLSGYPLFAPLVKRFNCCISWDDSPGLSLDW